MKKIYLSALFLCTTAAMYATEDMSSTPPKNATITINQYAGKLEGVLQDIKDEMRAKGYSQNIDIMFTQYFDFLKQSGEEEKAIILRESFDLLYLSDDAKKIPIKRWELTTYLGSGFKMLEISESAQYQSAYNLVIRQNSYMNKLLFLKGISSTLNLLKLLDGKSMDVLAIYVDRYAFGTDPGYNIKPLLNALLGSKLSLKKLILYKDRDFSDDEKTLLEQLKTKTQIQLSTYVYAQGKGLYDKFYEEATYDESQYNHKLN